MICTVLFWSLQTEQKTDLFLCWINGWLSHGTRSIIYLLDFDFIVGAEWRDVYWMNAGAQQFQRSSISAGYSINSLLFLVKMSRYCSLVVKALLVNPVVSFGFVRDLDCYIDHAGLLQTQYANTMTRLCVNLLLWQVSLHLWTGKRLQHKSPRRREYI